MAAQAETLDFTSLVDQDTGVISPDLLDDFKFGNQRGSRCDDEFSDLVESVRRHNLITPVTVRLNPDTPNRLELIAGHGRRDAAKLAKLHHVPFIFRQVDDQQAYEMHMSENLDREDLNIVSKAHAALRYMTQFKGDAEAVASKLNMKLKECRELLELNKCTDKVLDAVRNEHITPAHAIILAPFPKAAQDKNLERIIAEAWTVKTLRERAGKAKLPLDRGVFDKTECANCQYNTVPQLGLFSNNDAKAECAKPACFQEKTTAHMDAKRKELTATYGHILLLSETSDKERNNVSADVVGASQFETCQNCDNRVAVLTDAWGRAGEITENQCVDMVCFTKCKGEFAKEVKAQQIEIAKTSTDSVEAQQAAAAKKAIKTTKSTATGVLPNVVAEHYKKLLRQAAAQYYADDTRFIACLLTAALVSHAQFKREGQSFSRFSDVLVDCLSMTNEQRQSLTKQAAHHLLTETKSDSDNGNITDTLIRCLSAEKDTTLDFVTKFWMPTTENLNVYTKKLLAPLAKSAGVDKALESQEKGSFTKLLNQSKPELIKGIGQAQVDWESYAPKSFTAMISK
jgi:ParB family transcriptional regulator, chromosome partitioning protein